MTAFLQIATLAIVVLVVLALVVYLTGILIALVRAGTHLGRIAEGLARVAASTRPLENRVGAINQGLAELHQGLLAVDGQLVGIAKVFRLV